MPTTGTTIVLTPVRPVIGERCPPEAEARQRLLTGFGACTRPGSRSN